MSQPVPSRAHWSTRLAFILAAAGSAVGLGNIWKFPYITGVNGGGAFVGVYLVCIATVGLPIFIAELYIGQKSQANVVESFEITHRRSTPWRAIGWLGLASAFCILAFYSVVGGWVLDFTWHAVTNQFTSQTDEQIQGVLLSVFASPARQLFWHTIFMALTVGIVVQGLNAGLERWNRILMPGLFVLLALLMVRALFLPGFGASVSFLFRPDATHLTANGILVAVGHSFFTLSLGMGAIITYGSYVKSREDLVKTALAVALLDTVVALAAGIVIFSVVFSFGLQPGSGPTLMFQTLPMLFAKMTGGYFVAVAFFVLVVFAALTSSISLLEVVVAYWCDTHHTRRQPTALIAGGIIYALGILCALSSNLLANVKIIGLTFFDLFDKATSTFSLPFGGALIAIFFGWVLGPKAAEEAAGTRYRPVAVALMWASRIIAPAGVLFVLANGLGLISL